jgi:hypothetical protein
VRGTGAHVVYEKKDLLSPRVSELVGSDALPPAQSAFRSGSFNECLEWLLVKAPVTSFVQEATFFLFGYRSFASSAELLRLLDEYAGSGTPSRVWDFVQLWTKIVLPEQEQDTLQRMLALRNIPQPVANDVKLALLRKAKKTDSVDETSGGAAKGGFGNMMPAQWNAAQVAEQLTLIESQLFYAVPFEEFLDNASSGDSGGVRGPHLARLAARFNAVSYWAASQVLVQGGDSSQRRAAEIDRFIGVMEELRLLHNFNGAMAVMAGLNNAAILRLKEDWALVAPERRAQFEALEQLLDPARNFKRYREEVARVSRDAGKPLLPYVSVHLRDILFIELGNSREDKSVINYEKTLLFGNALSKLCYFQRHPYSIVRNAELHRYLSALEFLNEEQLHARSLQCRPMLSDAAAAGPAEGVSAASPVRKVRPSSEEQPAKSPRGIKALLLPRAGSAERSYDELEKRVNPLFGVKSDAAVAKEASPVKTASHPPAAVAAAPPLPAAVRTEEAQGPLSPRSSVLKQSMTRDGAFLVIPKNDAESLVFAKSTNEAGLRWLVDACEKRDIILPQSHYLRFFVVDHCNEKKALKHVVDYWTYYDSIGFKNIITTDVSAALLSHIVAPPLSPDWFDMEGRPLVVMRANLWFDGDPTQPTLEELKRLLMWIGEGLARNVQHHYTGFTFLMDMKDWTKRNFSTQVYTQLMHVIQYCLPVRCERFIFLDVPKVFGASWKLVSSTLRPDFKNIMSISTREDMLERLVDKFSLPPDLGGAVPSPDVAQYIKRKKAEEQEAIVPPAPGKKPELTPIAEDVFSDDPALRPGVYQLRIRGAGSRNNSPRVDDPQQQQPQQPQPKTLTSKNSSKLSFFKKKKKDDPANDLA